MRFRYAIAALCGLAVAVGAVAILSTGGSSPLNVSAVARAAETTAHSEGAQMLLSGTVTTPGATITMNGHGRMNFKAGEGDFTLTIGGLPAAAQAVLQGSSIEMTERMKAGAIYMDSPLFTGKLPGGVRWVKLDLASVTQATGLNPSSMTSLGANPSQYLSFLKAAGASMSAVGHAKIRGVATTHYAGRIDLMQAMEKEAGSSAKAREALSKMASAMSGAKMPVDVWIDGSGRVRKEEVTISVAAGGQQIGTKIDTEYFDFGSTPTVTVPASSEVYDLTQQSLQGLMAAQ